MSPVQAKCQVVFHVGAVHNDISDVIVMVHLFVLNNAIHLHIADCTTTRVFRILLVRT